MDNLVAKVQTKTSSTERRKTAWREVMRRGFTLIELLVALAVFSLAALALLATTAFTLVDYLFKAQVSATVQRLPSSQGPVFAVLAQPLPATQVNSQVSSGISGISDWR